MNRVSLTQVPAHPLVVVASTWRGHQRRLEVLKFGLHAGEGERSLLPKTRTLRKPSASTSTSIFVPTCNRNTRHPFYGPAPSLPPFLPPLIIATLKTSPFYYSNHYEILLVALGTAARRCDESPAVQ
ncbi:hypothetical protein E2C01_097275 [Portunus trituberculatus]|uniref:Uncharacterized protein n=1 Tax=Portunus trituberculatus TaxID=210409 RepID=A0A5B7KAT8_PORTR|nr:hypothetical protein [Portunus trituberculatus]